MPLRTLEEKKAYIRLSRSKNYRDSLRLEGISPLHKNKSHRKTIEEIIRHYTQTEKKKCH